MNTPSILALSLGLLIFSFLTTSSLMVPFIDILYKLKFTRKKSGEEGKKKALFDKLHDIKAGTPVGGGVLLILIVTLLYIFLFPFSSHMGVFIKSSFVLKDELFVILFTFLSFGLLGFSDDVVKIFSSGRKGERPTGGLNFGFKRSHKFILQWILAFIVSWVIYSKLGIHILHIPLVDITIDLGIFYVFFSAFMIVFFTNAFNITDGLDGLAGGLLVICLIAFGFIAASNLDTPLSLFISLWIGTLVSFLYFNVYPARIFLGDTGALSFGALLAVISLITGSVVALFVIGFIFVVEIISSAIQILGWKILKRPIFKVAPFHHALMASGWEEPKIVMRAWLAGLMLAIFGVWLSVI